MRILFPLIKNFSEIIVWYDNDSQGIKASKQLSDKINLYLGDKSRPITLPEQLNKEGITDPSDLVFRKSLNELTQFINQKVK